MHKPLFTLAILMFGIVYHNALGQSSATSRVDSLNDLSYDLGSSQLDLARSCALDGYKLAVKSNYHEGTITALYRIGRVFYKEGNYTSALEAYREAESSFNAHPVDSSFLAKAFLYQGLANRKMGKMTRAIQAYRMCYNIALSQKNFKLLGETLINISNFYKTQSKYNKALEVLNKALKHFPSTDHDNRGLVYLNIGNIYEIEKRFVESRESFQKAYDSFHKAGNQYSKCQSLVNIGNSFFEQSNLKLADQFYRKAYQLSTERHFTSICSNICQNRAELFYASNELDSALTCLRTCLDLKKANDDYLQLGAIYERLGDIHKEQGQTDQVLFNYLQSFAYSDTIGDSFRLITISKKLSDFYTEIGDSDKASNYSNLSRAYEDSVQTSINDALRYEVQFKGEENRAKLLKSDLMLEVEKNKRQEQNLQSAIIISVVAMALFLVVLVLFRIYRKKTRAEKQQVESKQQINDLLNREERVTLNAMLDGQETERNRIADELHDKLGATLSVVKLYFKSMDEEIHRLEEVNRQQFHKANELLDEACDEARKMAHELSSNYLNKLGLFKAIDSLKNNVNESGQVKMTLNTFGTDDTIIGMNEVTLYQIIQELTNNSLKHANASEISIQLNVFKEDNVFNILVEDDGVGFDIKTMNKISGIGLRSIEGRIKNLEGSLEIDSVPGRGTSVSIDIPINKRKYD